MEFLKKNYEKVVLSVVLVGLALAVGLLPFQIQSERKKLDDLRNEITGTPKKYQPMNLSEYDSALRQMTNPPALNFSGGHNLFNPVLWQIAPDGSRIKVVTGKEVGVQALRVTGITPLNYIISLERVAGNSYMFGITREAALRPQDRAKKTRYASMSSPKTEFFILKEVKGPPENPTEFVIELAGEPKVTGTLSKDVPFKQTEGYVVDLNYAPENLAFHGKRLNDSIAFGGDDYNIVDMDPNGIALSSRSSTKRVSIKYNAAP